MDIINSFCGQYRFLSNFSPSRIEGAHGIVYRTAEAAFQAGKTDDPEQRQRIAAARSPYQAKVLGRQIALPKDWDKHRHEVMRAVLGCKFSDAGLLRQLLDTGEAILIEGNVWHDNYWGDCSCGRKSCSGPGANRLGTYLMELRDAHRH